MLSESRMVYLFIYVSDLARSREFYETKVGLRVIEEDADCVKFDTGHVILALNRVADHPAYGISLPQGKDGSADIVFLVEDVWEMRNSLIERGVVFHPVDWYQPGGIADFYDPDGHWLSLYQPSAEAMSWPSGERIRSVVGLRRGRDAERGIEGFGGAPRAVERRNEVNPRLVERGLDGCELIYLFLFVYDAREAQRFYYDTLGLRAVEGGPCSQLSGGDEEGVVKYDAGGIIVATHHIEPQRTEAEVEEHLCPPRELVEGRLKSVAPVFHVSDMAVETAALTAASPGLRIRRSDNEAGAIASLEDPSGHLLFLYQPSERAFAWPSGAKLGEILALPLEGACVNQPAADAAAV
jgi:catechol 2,3-dioxygenase-like lactoylglutathione lyase family enzyme